MESRGKLDMHFKKFVISNYRAIQQPLTIDLSPRIIPLVGVNECGKTTILQAIYAFDSTNDKKYKGRHLANTRNLYETTQADPPSIVATIECKTSEIKEIIRNHIEELKGDSHSIQSELESVEDSLKEIEHNLLTLESQLAASPANQATKQSIDAANDELSDLKSQQKSHIKEITTMSEEIDNLESFVKTTKLTEIQIARILDKKPYYSTDVFSSTDLSADTISNVCYSIVQESPYILYNDDFNDRPVGELDIEDKTGQSTEWGQIYDRVFEMTDPNYSLYSTLNAEDEQQRNSIIADVQDFLSKTLTDSWSRFSPEKRKISIDLKISTHDSKLSISVIEEMKGGKSRYFSIADRSKGFIWYYNFIMKICFNSKFSGTAKNTVFLLDEPGSYLHESAQEELCFKLKDISKTNGVVVYCTHSPKLLNPGIVSIKDMLIVSKDKKYIQATPLPLKQTKKTKNSALQPVYEALQMPEYETIALDEKLVCVEGIYDKYAIESMCHLPDGVRVFPSVCADSIVDNIQFFIAYQKQYLALWDNDEEGRKAKKKAETVFGLNESYHFDLLPDISKVGKTPMERMFESDDYNILIASLGLPDNSTYETIVSTLFFSEKKKRSEVVKSISQQTKANFSVLEKIIKKHLS